MRRRINRTLLAATAASVSVIGLGFMAAGAAGAATSSTAGMPKTNAPSGGAPIDTCAAGSTGALACAAGYQASGRNFRYAQALITIPNRASTIADPELYVALDGSNGNTADYARAGIEPGATVGTWDAFVSVMEPTLNAPIDIVQTQLPAPLEGDGVLFSVYLNAGGNSVHFVTTLPSGVQYNNTVAVNGPLYTAAQALADWSFSTPAVPAAPTANTRVTQFLQGRFTTLNGTRGTFEGPWSLNPVEATSNGDAYPQGTLIAAPAYLWNDGNSLPGQGTDAFGLWLYSS
jgi:hypothetical protein